MYKAEVRRNAQMYKPLTQNIQVGGLVWYFDPRIIPGTSHKLRSEKQNTFPQCHGERGIQRDSILKIGMKLNRKKIMADAR